MTILDNIIAEKRKEVEQVKHLISINQLQKRERFQRSVFSLSKSVSREGSTGIIAEFKRKSPSKGIINGKARVEDVTAGYAQAGAAGLSILTDRHFFGGSAIDVISAREINQIPILRKEFIIDEYQIIEAKAMGADAILLIAACLNKSEIKSLATVAKSVGLEILLELHAEEELDKISDNIDLIGINNRNLKDFKVDLEHSISLANKLPNSFVKVSESGIDNPETIKMLRICGFKGFLIGENFMKTDDPAKACKEFIDQLK